VLFDKRGALAAGSAVAADDLVYTEPPRMCRGNSISKIITATLILCDGVMMLINST
jgi:hypothetical protein